MLVLNEAQTRDALPAIELIAAIEAMFRSRCVMPVRHHHEMEVPGEANAVMLSDARLGAGRPYRRQDPQSVSGQSSPVPLRPSSAAIFLSSGKTGEMLAIVDGGEADRAATAATSALAARYLAREDARSMLMVGTGRLSLNLMQAHARRTTSSSISAFGDAI